MTVILHFQAQRIVQTLNYSVNSMPIIKLPSLIVDQKDDGNGDGAHDKKKIKNSANQCIFMPAVYICVLWQQQ
ncbi:hypothetical protein HanIR_Chr03g0144961 [Helianthus annuus]|nr:hypothetical protein HanIR_Chr03g0144961 [Helianthus annuus]